MAPEYQAPCHPPDEVTGLIFGTDVPPPCSITSHDAAAPDPEEPSQSPQVQVGQKNSLFSVLFAVFLFSTGIAMTFAVRHQIILVAAGNNASLAAMFTGTVESCQSIVSIVLAPLLGAVSDVIGRKPILILSHLGEFFALMLMAQFYKSLVAIAIAYLAIALTNTYLIIINAIIVDSSSGSNVTTTTNFGLVIATFGLCVFIGTSIGGLVESHFYFASSLHLAAFTVLVAAIYVYIFLPETRWSAHQSDMPPSRSMEESSLLDRPILERIFHVISNTNVNPIPRIISFAKESEALQWLGITLCVTRLAQSGIQPILYLYAHVKLGWEIPQYATYLSIFGLGLLVSQAVLVWPVIKVLGERKAILIGMTLDAISYIVYGCAVSTRDMYVGLLLSMIGSVWVPAFKGVVARQTTPDRQGALQGSMSAVTDVVAPISPLITTVLFSAGQGINFSGLPFLVMGSLYAIGVLCARVALWKPSLVGSDDRGPICSDS